MKISGLIKKLILVGAIGIFSAKSFGQFENYQKPDTFYTKKEFNLERVNHIVEDLNNDRINDSLFWKKGDVYETGGFFSENKIDYKLLFIDGKDNKTEKIDSFCFRISNGEIPSLPELNLSNKDEFKKTKTITYWKGPYIKRNQNGSHSDCYNLREIIFELEGMELIERDIKMKFGESKYLSHKTL